MLYDLLSHHIFPTRCLEYFSPCKWHHLESRLSNISRFSQLGGRTGRKGGKNATPDPQALKDLVLAYSISSQDTGNNSEAPTFSAL